MMSSVSREVDLGVALDQRAQRHGGEVVGPHVLQRALGGAPDRRADRVDDDGFGHGSVSLFGHEARRCYAAARAAAPAAAAPASVRRTGPDRPLDVPTATAPTTSDVAGHDRAPRVELRRLAASLRRRAARCHGASRGGARRPSRVDGSSGRARWPTPPGPRRSHAPEPRRKPAAKRRASAGSQALAELRRHVPRLELGADQQHGRPRCLGACRPHGDIAREPDRTTLARLAGRCVEVRHRLASGAQRRRTARRRAVRTPSPPFTARARRLAPRTRDAAAGTRRSARHRRRRAAAASTASSSPGKRASRSSRRSETCRRVPLAARAGEPGLAQHAQVVRARRLGDAEVERAADRLAVGRERAHDLRRGRGRRARP